MRLAVIGVGLIGGSFALALKQAGRVAHVVGAGRSRANLELARERRIIDSIAPDAAAAARGADLVLVAARAALGARIAQFVPGHPVAGAELSGAAAATAGLFLDRRVVLTPLPENRPESIQRVEQAWKACGARIARLDPEEHDAVLAAVSHLPHLLAYALVHDIAFRDNAAQLFAYAAGGFRDFTRIASSHPEMWRDICLANRKALLVELRRYGGELERVKKMLEHGDAKALDALFSGARDARERWLKDGE